MGLSAYPTPIVDYQILTENYPYLIRILSVSHPHPFLHLKVLWALKYGGMKNFLYLCNIKHKDTEKPLSKSLRPRKKHAVYGT